MWHLLPRLRFAFARRPLLYWLVAGTCALTIAGRVHTLEAAATQARQAWGTSRAVWVATAPSRAGEVLHLAQRRYPTAMVPPTAVNSVSDGARAARAVGVGQVLVPDDLAGARTPPSGWVVLAVPVEHTPHLVAGDPVVVLHAGQATCDGLMTGGGGDRPEIAVPVACAGAVSTDLATVVVARRTAPTYGAVDDRP